VITSSGSPCGSEAGPWPGSGRNHRLSSSGSRCSDSEASHLVEMLRFLVVRMSRPSKAVAAVSASKCVVPTRFGHPRVSSGRTTCPDASMSSSTLDELFTTRRDTPAGAAAPAWVQRPCWWSWCRAYGRSDAVPAIDEGYNMEHLTAGGRGAVCDEPLAQRSPCCSSPDERRSPVRHCHAGPATRLRQAHDRSGLPPRRLAQSGDRQQGLTQNPRSLRC